MRKQLTICLMLFALLMTMAGCSAANAVRMLDAAEDQVEAKLDAAEKTLEDRLRDAVLPAPETNPAASEPSGKLTGEQAEKIALDYLGLTADQVTRMHSEYEIDDGIPRFDVAFCQGDWEYEFEIHAENGRILSCDKDHKYD